MNNTLVIMLSGSVVLAAGAAVLATSAQEGTKQPGQATQSRVWIENRGDSEAVPVSIQSLSSDMPPLKVQVVAGPAATTARVPQDSAARRPWEYESLTVPRARDLAAALNVAGAEGWETTGISFTTQSETVVMMKRPK